MKQANLSLRGAIGQEVSCFDLASTIDSLSREGVEALTLDICSMGGSVFDGNNLISSLKSFPGQITIQIDFAASMAAIIAMRPSRVRMDASGILMFHKPYDPSTGSRDSEMLQKLAFSAIQEVSQNRNIPYQKLEPIFDAERWLTAQEALELGFIDEIYTTRELSKGQKRKLKTALAKSPEAAYAAYAKIMEENMTIENPETVEEDTVVAETVTVVAEKVEEAPVEELEIKIDTDEIIAKIVKETLVQMGYVAPAPVAAVDPQDRRIDDYNRKASSRIRSLPSQRPIGTASKSKGTDRSRSNRRQNR